MSFAKRNTLFGPIGIQTDGKDLTRIYLREQDFPDLPQNDADPLLNRAFTELEEYFCGKRKTFDLPLKPEGTPFQKKVWSALQKIPYGETRSYREIAEEIGCPNGCRAVGMANHENPIAIMIPCHRVIGTNGTLTGYAGGLAMKEKLLKLEGILLC